MNKETEFCRMAWAELLPFRRWLPLVDRRTLRADLLAGLTGAAVVLPQGVAFATIAGLPPQYGLYSAMIPAIIAALFGSSLHLVSGPTTPISIVLFASLAHLAPPGSERYVSLCLTITFLAGLLQLTMGLARMGALVNFVSNSVVVGFSAGAAILIAGSQMGSFLGIQFPDGSSFSALLEAILEGLPNTNPLVLTVGVATLAVAVLFQATVPRLPGMLLALVLGGTLAWLLRHLGHGDIPRVGAFPASLPPLSAPLWDMTLWRELATAAFAVALLSLIQAVSIARSVALQSKQRLNSNQEFIGQGLSNIVGSFFSAYASSGSFTRSGINYRVGAQTPLAAIFASLLLIVIVLAVAPLAAYLPLASMSGVILLVAYGLIDTKSIRLILRTSRAESLVMGATFLATLLVKLEFAIYLGVISSLFYYLKGRATPQMTRMVPSNDGDVRHLIPTYEHPECPQLTILRVDGSLFFGSVGHVSSGFDCLATRESRSKNLLLMGTAINFLDVDGAQTLAQEALRRRGHGGRLFLFDLHESVREVLERSGFVDTIGRKAVFTSAFEAIHDIAMRHVDHAQCRLCKSNVFMECEQIRCLANKPPGTGGE
ncbi:MAG: SulP family inorganic anion transporter [Magnetococcales bacterium]|nr:SulP family inorganic anion transporter [Magnetococcales bacterium]